MRFPQLLVLMRPLHIRGHLLNTIIPLYYYHMLLLLVHT